jgi:hypothetical protein
MDSNMKKLHFLLIAFGLLVSSNSLFGQAKKPTLMILPSDNWCEQRYFMTEFDNLGTKQKVPNYKQAFQEDTEIGQVISKIGSLMIDRGFPLKDAEQELKGIEARNAENNMTQSNASAASLTESPLDMLKNKAKADIIIQIWWKVSKTDNGKVISFVLEAFDSYTGKRIASSSGNSAPGNDIVPVLLETAILNNIDPFVNQLQSHFNDLLQNGREIRLTVRTWDNWAFDLESKFGGIELRDIIYEWIEQNTVGGRFNETNSSENRIDYEQLRIPVFDDKGRALDARQYARKLVAFLESAPFNFEVKLIPRGLGEVVLVLGEK